ncbi:alkaline phosphatase D family protein [Novosphingobium album (ex Liu et al. 2023)]|uniref:Alkaline phosphatase D family protein n=1 Tax=Novosphingobium album (ex Liu et al. 2023) TaxID=3031130 RepID=A0ABT5WSI2_9SPHN|nr:alkaline phosphatase D family protein [Novosphingobium album (ex Liu et al. 2023)]MDE8652998.1 alkaline phosphatase D family protein [Novosphingobium album (ex Liu et al. 2023)]
MKLDRRAALGLIGSGAALPAATLPGMALAAAPAAPATFRHGVASGDPTPRGAILWTRVTPADAAHATAVPVRWHVAASAQGKPLESGSAEARPARDFTVKVEPTKLKAGTDYWYWFELADGTRSPVGRFRTLPVGKADDLVLAVATCQLFVSGFYNAYDHMAKLDRLDAVVHLGDYIYEYGPDQYGASIGAKIGRTLEPAHEIVTLADYRARHAWYKSDPNLQAAHARAAFICVWDDHETANDSWTDGAENHQPASEGDWAARKAAALQAYFEWLPIRDPQPGKPWAAINRGFTFGDLATLMMVETRLLARSEQVSIASAAPTAESIGAVLARVNRPDREMLGEPQREWLEQGLAASVKAGVPWQVIGNQVVMARVNGPDLDKAFGADTAKAMLAAQPEAFRAQIEEALAGYRLGLPYNLDAWDGYPAARERLYASFRRAGSEPLVLAGDSHAFWANNLADAKGQPVAVEFGTSAISSPSVGDSMPQLPLGQLLAQASPEVAFCDQRAKGYILLTLTPDRAEADYVGMSTVFTREYEAKSLARFTLDARAKARKLARKDTAGA